MLSSRFSAPLQTSPLLQGSLWINAYAGKFAINGLLSTLNLDLPGCTVMLYTAAQVAHSI